MESDRLMEKADPITSCLVRGSGKAAWAINRWRWEPSIDGVTFGQLLVNDGPRNDVSLKPLVVAKVDLYFAGSLPRSATSKASAHVRCDRKACWKATDQPPIGMGRMACSSTCQITFGLLDVTVDGIRRSR